MQKRSIAALVLATLLGGLTLAACGGEETSDEEGEESSEAAEESPAYVVTIAATYEGDEGTVTVTDGDYIPVSTTLTLTFSAATADGETLDLSTGLTNGPDSDYAGYQLWIWDASATGSFFVGDVAYESDQGDQIPTTYVCSDEAAQPTIHAQLKYNNANEAVYEATFSFFVGDHYTVSLSAGSTEITLSAEDETDENSAYSASTIVTPSVTKNGVEDTATAYNYAFVVTETGEDGTETESSTGSVAYSDDAQGYLFTATAEGSYTVTVTVTLGDDADTEIGSASVTITASLASSEEGEGGESGESGEGEE